MTCARPTDDDDYDRYCGYGKVTVEDPDALYTPPLIVEGQPTAFEIEQARREREEKEKQIQRFLRDIV